MSQVLDAPHLKEEVAHLLPVGVRWFLSLSLSSGDKTSNGILNTTINMINVSWTKIAKHIQLFFFYVIETASSHPGTSTNILKMRHSQICFQRTFSMRLQLQ